MEGDNFFPGKTEQDVYDKNDVLSCAYNMYSLN